MDKPRNKKPMIPEMDIPDVADYHPSDSFFSKIGIRAYIFMRTKPGLFAGSLFALAFTAGIIGYTASHFGKSDEIVFEANHIDQFNDTSNQAPIGHDFDNRIEVSDAEELRTSIKPLNIPAPEEPSGSSLSSTVSKSERLNVTAIPIDAPRGEGSAPPPDTGTKASINVFEERFGSSDLDITSPEQAALAEALARIGTLEDTIENLKEFPFDKILTDTPRYAILKIAEGADATSGFWREVGDNDQTREEYFLVVSAVDEETGENITVDVQDMDSGAVKRESSWAVLTNIDQFISFAESKNDDGKFSNPVLGKMNLDTGEIEWNIDTDGKALVDWKEFAE